MPILNPQIKATNKMLLAARNNENKKYIDILIQLELEDQKLLKIFTENYFHSRLINQYSYSAGGESAKPELIKLLKGLLDLRIRLPENPDTVLTDLIKQFTHDTLQLVHNVVVRNTYKPLKCNPKTGLNALANTVNCTVNIIDAAKKDDEYRLEGSVMELIANANTMQEVLSGSRFERALLTQALLITAVLLVGAALLATPFILLAAGVTGMALALISVLAPMPGIIAMSFSLALLTEIAARIEPNKEVRKVKDGAIGFMQNSQRFFASTGKVKHQEEIELGLQRGFVAA
jgi:hypothetical protein